MFLLEAWQYQPQLPPQFIIIKGLHYQVPKIQGLENMTLWLKTQFFCLLCGSKILFNYVLTEPISPFKLKLKTDIFQFKNVKRQGGYRLQKKLVCELKPKTKALRLSKF